MAGYGNTVSDSWNGFFGDARPFIISGPCSAETEDQVLSTARELASAGVRVFRSGLWKPRTMPGCFEGVGADGLPWLQRVRAELGMLTCTEVGSASHVEQCLSAGLDALWIGARTSVNPFAVQEIADSLEGADVPVFVKNPISADVKLWAGAVERLSRRGVRRIGLVHRGFATVASGAYRNNPGWHLAVEMRSRFPELPFLCDPSHMGGDRKYVEELSLRAMEIGFDGLMVETHCNPDSALSDAAQQLRPSEFAAMLKNLAARQRDTDDSAYRSKMASLRARIDIIDDDLVRLLAERMEVSAQIGRCKKDCNVALMQPTRWEDVLSSVLGSAAEYGLDTGFVTRVFNEIHEASIAEQNKIQ